MKIRILAVGVALLLTLTGCTGDPLANDLGDGSGTTTGDGAYLELSQAQRDEPIVFEGTDVEGNPVSSDQFSGQVYVVNFWYASCPPCRVEAPILKSLSEEYVDVPFLGVNIDDTADFAATFERTFGIRYPSILDNETAAVQLAFAGAVAPNAVPTTLVIDSEGRVAARISGLIRDESILAGMIDAVLDEDR